MTKQGKDIENALEDFRALYHNHMKTLQALVQLITPTIDYLSPDPFTGRGAPTDADVERAFRGPLGKLLTSLEKFHVELTVCGAEWRISDSQIKNFDQRIVQFKQFRDEMKPKILATWLRQWMTNIDVWFNNVRVSGARLPNELVVSLTQAMSEVNRLCCLYSLHVAIERVASMDEHAHAIQRKVVPLLSQGNKSPELAVTTMLKLIKAMVKDQLNTYATSRRIEFKIVSQVGEGPYIKVSEHEVTQALFALLHNALKYNYQLQDEKAWVTVRLHSDGYQSVAEIESWGVPITRDEIERNLIFEPNYRGVYAMRDGLEGTGSGMGYARDVARRHGGDVTVTSRPANTSASPDNYDQPFITTVRFSVKTNAQIKR